MKLIWTPEDGEPREWLFQPRKLLSPEAEAIEDVGGATWDNFPAFTEKLAHSNMKALRAALWVMRKRTEPRLRFDQVVIRVGEVDLDLDDEERADLNERVLTGTDLSVEERLALIEALGLEPEDPKAPPSESPSDSMRSETPSPTGEPSTAG
jgi:hypothetical protein